MGDGGGVASEGSSIEFNGGKISNNTADNGGGAIHAWFSENEYKQAIFSNVIINDNFSNHAGTITIDVEGENLVTFQNTLINNNVGGSNGSSGIYASGGGNLVLHNVSITNNYCPNNFENCSGSLSYFPNESFSTSLTIINSILWNHSNTEFEFSVSPASEIDIKFSNIKGGYDGENVIDADPMFCNQNLQDFQLGQNSPSVGSGTDGSNMGALGIGCIEGQDWENEFLSLDKNVMPVQYTLHQNYPNPFNPATKISYDLPEASFVTLSIYDLIGREIRTMINSEQTAGFKNIQWNATDNLGKSVPAGMYIYTIQAGEFRQTRKMVLLK